MVRENEKRVNRIIGWKVAEETLKVIMGVGGGLCGCGGCAALFLAIAATGAAGGMYKAGVLEQFSPLPQIAGGAMGLGLLVILIGAIPYGITSWGYHQQVKNIHRSKDREEAVVDYFMSRVQNKDYGKLTAYVDILGDFGNKRATPSIILALQDENKEIRQKAAQALEKIGDERAIEPLATAMQDKSKEVRKNAARAINKLEWTPKDDKEKVHYFIADEKWGELAKFGELAIDPLIKVLKDEDKNIRQNAAKVLGEIGHRKAVVALTEALKDKEKKVSEAASQALREIKKWKEEENEETKSRMQDGLTETVLAGLTATKTEKEKRIDHYKQDLVAKTERELLAIWHIWDTSKYSEEELEAVRQILNERGHAFRMRKYRKE